MAGRTIDFTKSEQYTLSIRLSTDGFSFSIDDLPGKTNLYFQTFPVNSQRSMAANVKAFLAECSGLAHNYRQTNILIHTSRYTLVPLEFFEDEQMEMFFYQNLPRRNNEIVLCNVLGNSNLAILFSTDKLAHLLLSEHFSGARFFSSVSPQIEYFANRNRQGGSGLENGYKVYANIHRKSMDVMVYGEGRLQLANTFAANHTADRCYYLLAIWKQCAYSQEQDELYLTGEGRLPHELAGKLEAYIRKISIINPRTEPDVPQEHAGDIPFDMQSLLICE